MTASRTSSSGRRTARAASAALVLGVAAIAGLSACSAGQIAQTAGMVSAVQGANVDGGPVSDQFPKGSIGLRNVQIQYNGVQGYTQGASAPLVVRIFNSGVQPIRLVKVTADGAAESVRLVGNEPTATPLPVEPAGPTGSATPSASPSASAQPTPTTPTPTTPAPAGEGTFSIEIPAASYVLLVPGSGPYLQLTGLTKPIGPGNLVTMVFSFAGGWDVPVQVPFGTPLTAVPRGSAVPAGAQE